MTSEAERTLIKMSVSLSVAGANIFIVLTCLGGLLYSAFNWILLRKIKLRKKPFDELLSEENDDEQKTNLMLNISEAISKGANEFLVQEYKWMTVFVVIMAIIVLVAVDITEANFQIYTTIAFIIGVYTSVICGFLGMKIAVYANVRTAFAAQDSLGRAFVAAFRAGCVMGFSLVSISLLVLTIIIIIYRSLYGNLSEDDANPGEWNLMYDCVAGYALGGSTVALFGRVGGGIYTKAADVGADLVGKVEHELPEDSPKNPATIADNVGDNVGDIVGMGTDLFGSFAESTCAALVIGSDSKDFCQDSASLYFPLIISTFGLIACFLTSFFATHIMKVTEEDSIKRTLKFQLFISSILLTPALYGAAAISLPADFSVENKSGKPIHAWICTMVGLWSGLIIGAFTEVMTSHSYYPVRHIANSCKTGPATTIIMGLAYGYFSTIVPIISLVITIYVSLKLLGMFGISLAALGMLSNLALGLAIDAYGPISDNAGGIAEMSHLGENIRRKTDALDAAGNTTAAIGKGFAIGSAALVSLALYCAFCIRARASLYDNKLSHKDILDPLIISGLFVGAMLPYAFSAMTMKSVGKAALSMVVEVRRQLQTNPKIKTGEEDPDYKACVRISTQASLKEMIAPGALVVLTPLVVGFFFGPQAIAGLLPGALISGIQMAISMSNSGGAWDNAKKYIEAGNLIIDGKIHGKTSHEHKAAVIGDTVGDPLKDTSGPSINILIKLMAIISLVFNTFFCRTGYLVGPFGDR